MQLAISFHKITYLSSVKSIAGYIFFVQLFILWVKVPKTYSFEKEIKMRKKLLLNVVSLCALAVCVSFVFEARAEEIEVEEEIFTFQPIVDNVKPALIGKKSVHTRRRFDRARHALAKKESLEEKYADFKKMLNDKMGLSYTFDMSVLSQRGAPNGEKTAWQTQYYGSANWNMYNSSIGAGSLQAAYTYVHYWGNSAETIGNNIGVVSDINDYSNNS